MPDYIKQLRHYVGSCPLIIVGAGVLLLDSQDRILLILRTDNTFWGIPGGSLEPGEYLAETARREIKEETGIIAEKLEMFKVFSGPDFYYKYPNGDQVYNIVAIFTCCDFKGIPKADGKEASKAKWFAKNELPREINPVDRIILHNFLEIEKE